jgi:hypothetical protein
MARSEATTSIEGYLRYQEEQGRPDPSCQVQGVAGNQNISYATLREIFRMKPHLRPYDVNLLDMPVQSDLNLSEQFKCPKFIASRDWLQYAIPMPKDAYKITQGVKVPSLQRWMIGSGQGCLTGFHRDVLGLWTAVEVQSRKRENEEQHQEQGGQKLWAWVEQCEENVAIRREHGPFGGLSEYTKVFAVLLNPGDLFIMPPGLLHAVYTVKDAFAAGVHFLLPETLDRSVITAKDDVKDDGLTNVSLVNVREYYANVLEVRLVFCSKADYHK